MGNWKKKGNSTVRNLQNRLCDNLKQTKINGKKTNDQVERTWRPIFKVLLLHKFYYDKIKKPVYQQREMNNIKEDQ